MPVVTSPDGHFFQYPDGRPFFYLADTVWMLFNHLTENEIRELFADRAAKGFTVIHAVVFRDFFEPNTPNAEGLRPFADDSDLAGAKLNPAWIDFVVRITRIASEYDLVMGLLPTWGDKWNEHSNSAGPVVMDREKGRDYCRVLSDALGCCDNVIWILGGDSPIRTQEHCAIVRAMAEGIRGGASNDKLITFHPCGGETSAIFHSEPWLDFHSTQSGHGPFNNPNYREIRRMYHTAPCKPCLDLEPNFEWMPDGIRAQNGIAPEHRAYFNDYDIRKSLYRSVLAGAAGFAYGCDPIRQVHRRGDKSHAWDGKGIVTWNEALAAPGSSQLHFLKDALLDRSYFTRLPAQDALLQVLGGDNSDPAAHIAVARCRECSYVMVYIPVRQTAIVDTSFFDAQQLKVSFYDPASGKLMASWDIANEGEFVIRPLRVLDSFVLIETT
jgi:hypothetical protein